MQAFFMSRARLCVEDFHTLRFFNDAYISPTQNSSARRMVYVSIYIHSPAFGVPFFSARRTVPQVERFRT